MEADSRDRLHHVAIAVSDVESAVRWYRRSFDCVVAYQDDTWALLEFATVHLALVTPGEHPPHIGIARPDADEFGELAAHRDGTRYVYLNDPSGNTVEVLDSRSLG